MATIEALRKPVAGGNARVVKLRSWMPQLAAVAGIGLATPLACWMGVHTTPDPAVHDIALFAHLASLIVSLGAVVSVDWVALRWINGRRVLADVVRAADDVHLLIWIGYTGLVLSGMLLSPNLASTITQIKLGAVVLIGWNGLLATALSRRMHIRPTHRLLMASAASAGISQAAWWTATTIGFLNAR